MNLKILTIILFVLTISSCSENNQNKKNNLQKDSVNQTGQGNDDTVKVKDEEKIYTLDNFYSENYSTNQPIQEEDFLQIGFTKNGLFLIVTELFWKGKLILLVDENKNIIDAISLRNQTGDEYDEQIFVELFPNDLVSYVKEARDYVVENPEVMVTKSLYIVDKDGFTDIEYKKIKDVTEDKIQAIRYYFKTVNDCINSGNCKKRNFNDGTDNKEYTYYNCKLFFCRLDIKWEDAVYQYVSNYYFIGGKLFFIFKQQFNKNQETDKLQNESRYYFFKDELILIVDGKEKNTLSELEMKGQQEALLKEKNDIEKQLVNLRKEKNI